MQPVLTPLEMTAADQHAIATGTPEEVLVERAGRAVARHARRMLGGTYGRRVTVMAGKGNNGADGRVAARLLRSWGVGVDELLVTQEVDPTDMERALARSDLVIDAMFGTGFRGRLEGTAAMATRAIDASSVPVLAVDIPSGVDGATGAVADAAVRADETICFAAYKPGLLFEPGSSYAGRIRVTDIGIDVAGGSRLAVFEGPDLTLPAPGAASHKWSSGCLVVGGSSGMVGAPLLAGTAALRCGAGMVVCAVPGAAAAAQVSGRELVARALAATPDGALAEDAAAAVLKDVSRFRALAIGPGLGRDAETQAAVRRIVTEADLSVVIDADALERDRGRSLGVARTRRGRSSARGAHAARGRVRTARGQSRRRRSGRGRARSRRPLARDRVAEGPGDRRRRARRARDRQSHGRAGARHRGHGRRAHGRDRRSSRPGRSPFDAAATGAYVHGRAADAAPTSPDIVASDLVSALPRTLQGLRGGADPWEK